MRTPPRLDLICAQGESCPAAVGMVVFRDRAEPERCTGALVEADRFLTASHCIPTALREPGRSCRGAWVSFAASGDAPQQWVECDRVEHAVDVREDDVLRQDHALLRLRRPLDRATLPMDVTEVDPGDIVTVFSITPHRIYPTQHRLDARLCRVESASRAEHALGPAAQRVGWLSGCPIHPGHSGSPVIDYHGRIRAIVHAGSHPFFAVGVTSRLPPN